MQANCRAFNCVVFLNADLVNASIRDSDTRTDVHLEVKGGS